VEPSTRDACSAPETLTPCAEPTPPRITGLVHPATNELCKATKDKTDAMAVRLIQMAESALAPCLMEVEYTRNCAAWLIKAPGGDAVPTKLLHYAGEAGTCAGCEAHVGSSAHPLSWCHEFVVYYCKANDLCDPSHYHPLALLPALDAMNGLSICTGVLRARQAAGLPTFACFLDATWRLCESLAHTALFVFLADKAVTEEYGE
jgi:hypothetical protein